MKKLLILGLLIETVTALSCQAVDFYLSNTLNSSHVFRGAVINNETVWQPSLEFDTDSGFYGWVWANMDLSNNGGITDSTQFSEADLMLGYSHSFHKVTLSCEYTEYTYPGSSADGTREILLRASYDTFLNPTITVVEDFGEVNGMYAMFSVSQELFSYRSLSLDAVASFGWADKDYNLSYFGFYDDAEADACLGLIGTYRINDRLSLMGHVKYMTLMDKGLQYAAYTTYGHENHVWGGLSVDYSF